MTLPFFVHQYLLVQMDNHDTVTLKVGKKDSV